MTPETYAKTLVEKFRNEYAWVERDYHVDLYRDAKQCSLICVEEIISILEGLSISESGTTTIDYGQLFYQQVKLAINNLP